MQQTTGAVQNSGLASTASQRNTELQGKAAGNGAASGSASVQTKRGRGRPKNAVPLVYSLQHQTPLTSKPLALRPSLAPSSAETSIGASSSNTFDSSKKLTFVPLPDLFPRSTSTAITASKSDSSTPSSGSRDPSYVSLMPPSNPNPPQPYQSLTSTLTLKSPPVKKRLATVGSKINSDKADDIPVASTSAVDAFSTLMRPCVLRLETLRSELGLVDNAIMALVRENNALTKENEKNETEKSVLDKKIADQTQLLTGYKAMINQMLNHMPDEIKHVIIADMNYLNGLEISQSGGIPPPMPPSHQHQQYYPYQHPYQYPADPRYPMYSPIQQFPPQFPPVQHYHPGYAPQHTQSYAPPSSLRPQSSKKNLVGDSTIKRKRMDMETGNPASQPLQPQPARQPDFQEEMLEEETFQDDVIPEESESEETQKRQLPHHGHNQSTNAQSLKILAHSAACLEEHNTQMVSHKNTKKAKLVSADSSAVTPQSGPKDKELLNSYFPSSNVATLRAAVALHAKSSQQTTAGSISNVEASPTTDSTNRTRFDGHSKGYHDGIECGGISDDDNDDIDSGTSEPENCKEQTAPVIDDENEPLHQDDVEKIGSAKSTICVPSMSKKLLSFGIGADTISSIELVDPFGLLYVGEKGVVQVWDIKQSNATTTMKSAVLDCKTNAFVRFTKIAPDRKTLVVGGQFDKLVFFDLQTNTIKMTADVASLKSAAISAVITSDARSLVTAHQSGHIDLWDIRQGRLVLNLGKHLDAAVGCNVLNSNGPENTFVSGSVDGTIATWDSRACGTDSQTSLYVTMHSVNAPIYSLSNDPTRPGICSVGLSNGSLEVWNLSTNAPWPVKLLPNAHQKSILGVNYSRDGSWVLSMASRSFKAWSTETFEQLVETEIEDAMFCDVSGCGKYVVTGSSKATISLFELQSESPI